MSMTNGKAILELAKTFDINSIYASRVFQLADKTKLIEDASHIISEKPKPFVKWVGGKRQLLTQFRLMNLYPPEKFNPKSGKYFEPFVGGGAVFFDLLPETAYLSDLNNELVVTYNVIKNDVENLIKSLKKHKLDKEYFLKIRAQNPEKLSDLNTASRFIYLNRTCFNGMYRVNSKGGFNVPFGKYTNPLICDENNLRKASKALKNVEIKKQDYKEVLKKAKKGDFVYFDPPYYPVSKTASFTSYTSEAFLDKEQIELRNTFVELHKRGCFVMLSNSDTPFINKIYSEPKGLRITKVQAGRAINSDASKRGKITEVLVTNY
ncbi:MAG: adenine methylase protein [Parcubacteria group bacterium GW2011_GWA2_33_14]|nr:MAG: adenine methylase protein [Parcubacteria group bacterium GW2011_GWA2_33_14]